MPVSKVGIKSRSSDQRQLQLINATIKAISTYGLSKLTITKVAKIANLSQGIVNFYFKSKDQLLLATLEFVSDEYNHALNEVFNNTDNALDTLHKVIDVSFDPKLCSPDKVVIWYAFWSETQARNDYLKICSQDDQIFRAKLTELFSTVIKNYELSQVNPVALARGFEGIIDDYWQEFLTDSEKFDRQQARKTCKDYLNAFFPVKSKPNIKSKPESLVTTDTVDLLPPWTYHNPEFYELEKELIFKRNWLLVGHVSDIPKTGDYLTFDAVDERALILRKQDNSIAAFHNVCRHRGAKVVEASKGNCPRALVCPFHGWSYHLDGSVRHIPKIETFKNLDKQASGLVPIALEIWSGFIFINFTNGVKSIAATMAPVADKFAPYKLDALEPLPGSKYCQQRPYNWKIIHDIDNEGYHVPIGHPSLQQLYGQGYEDKIEHDIPVSYGYINDKPGKLWSVRNYQKILPEFEHLPAENQRLWLYTGIFPSMVIGFYPDMIEFYMSIPTSPTTSNYIGGAYALPDNRREVKLSRYLTGRINQSTEREDESFVSWIQEGIQSSVFPKLQLSSLEHGVKHLHNQIQQRIPVARLSKKPAAGTVAAINESMINN